MVHIINRTKRTGDIVVATDVAPEGLRSHVTEDSVVVMESFDHQPSSVDHEQTELTMDPVSTTASIAGLLAIATSLVKCAYFISTSARDFRNEWNSIANEVAQLVGVLHSLKPSFGSLGLLTDQILGESTSSSPTGSIPSSLSTPSEKEYDVLSVRRAQEYLSTQLSNEIANCQATLIEVEQLLSQSQLKAGRRMSNVTKQFLWPLKKPEFQRLMEKLESHKSTFVLIFSSHGTYAPSKI